MEIAPTPKGFSPGIRLSGAVSVLKHGSDVQALVVGKQGSNRYVLQIAGHRLTAHSSLNLQLGQALRARVDAQAGTVYLRVQNEQSHSLRVFLQQQGLPVDKSAEAVVRSFVRSGLPLDPAEIRQARALLQRVRTPAERSARLVAILWDKGARPSEDFVHSLFSAVEGEPSDSGTEGRRQDSGRHSYGNPHRHDDNPGDGAESGAHEGQDPEKQDSHKQGEEDAYEEDEEVSSTEAVTPLQLFNALKGREGRWLVVPFALQGSEESYRGSLRLFLDGTSGEYRIAVCTVREERVSFDIAWNRGAAVAHLYPRDEQSEQRVAAEVEELERRLAPFGIAEVRVHESTEFFDGFSTDEAADIIPRIDERA
jgi:hypothetical protein